MLKRIDHIELRVENIEEAAQKMQEMGFLIHKRNPDHGPSIELVLPGPDQPVWEIAKADEKDPLGIPHIAFRDEGEGMVETLKASNHTLERERWFNKTTGRYVTNIQWPNKKSSRIGMYFQIIHY